MRLCKSALIPLVEAKKETLCNIFIVLACVQSLAMNVPIQPDPQYSVYSRHGIWGNMLVS